MAYSEPRITEHVSFASPLGQRLDEPAVKPEVLAAASCEAGEREMAFVRDMNRGFSSPKPPPPKPDPRYRRPPRPYTKEEPVTRKTGSSGEPKTNG